MRIGIHETITDIGGGDYRYEYSFENVDSSTIWGFGIYTTFDISGENTFAGYPAWVGPSNYSVDAIPTEYDARNLDLDITYLTNTSYEYWFHGEDDGIQINDIATGFTFISSVYDTSPKYYMYETIEYGWTDTNGTGKVAAVGTTTTPEPVTLSLLGIGSLILLGRRKSP